MRHGPFALLAVMLSVPAFAFDPIRDLQIPRWKDHAVHPFTKSDAVAPTEYIKSLRAKHSLTDQVGLVDHPIFSQSSIVERLVSNTWELSLVRDGIREEVSYLNDLLVDLREQLAELERDRPHADDVEDLAGQLLVLLDQRDAYVEALSGLANALAFHEYASGSPADESTSLLREVAQKLIYSQIVTDLRDSGVAPFFSTDHSSLVMAEGFEGLAGATAGFPFEDNYIVGGGASELPEAHASSILDVSVSAGSQIETEMWLSQLWPWPPPPPSSRVVLPKNLFRTGATLGDVDDVLREAIDAAGFPGPGYWGVPGGFALVTPSEQTDGNGKPLAGNDRWKLPIVPMKEFSFSEFFRVFASAAPGYYRVLAFVITPKPFRTATSREKLDIVETWARGGSDRLPEQVRQQRLTADCQVTVLVYEFVRGLNDEWPEVIAQGSPAQDHLRLAGLSSLVRP